MRRLLDRVLGRRTEQMPEQMPEQAVRHDPELPAFRRRLRRTLGKTEFELSQRQRLDRELDAAAAAIRRDK